VTITEFLEERIAEDEARANASIANYTPDEWDNPSRWANHYAADVEFWDAHTPYRVLAECAAKRAIIAVHETVPTAPGRSDTTCAGCGMAFGERPCPTLRALAAVYSSHDDYDSGWAL